MAKKKKAGKKVSCAVCKNQYNKFCTVKRVSVSLNKKRLCNKYVFEESKVKEGVPIPTSRVGYGEKELIKKEEKAMRREMRKEIMSKLKEEGKVVKKDVLDKSRIWMPSGNEKYPLTGDLSRFTTTGSTDDENKS